MLAVGSNRLLLSLALATTLGGGDGIPTGGLLGVGVVDHVKVAAQVLGSDKGEDNDVDVDAGHEDGNDLAVVVALLHLERRGQGEALADAGLDGGRGRGDEVAELVRGADDKGAERTGRQLHEVDGDDAPGALDAELLEKGGGHDGVGADKGVRVEEGATDDAAADDAEAAADGLGEEADDGAAGHGAEVGDDLGNGDLVGREVELVLQHGRVEILAAVAHEVEAGHEEDEVGEEHPVLADGDAALLEEDGADGDAVVGALSLGLFADTLALTVDGGFGHHETEDDEEHGRAGTEPV